MKKKLCFTLDADIIKMIKAIALMEDKRTNQVIEEALTEYIKNHK